LFRKSRIYLESKRYLRERVRAEKLTDEAIMSLSPSDLLSETYEIKQSRNAALYSLIGKFSALEEAGS
jgi:hypothetical protein